MDEERSSYTRSISVAVLIGLVSGCGSLLFFEGLKAGTSLFMGTLLGFAYPLPGQGVAEISTWAPPDNIWVLLPIICFGGLISGMVSQWWAPEVEGAGKDAAIKAFHGTGEIRKRVPFLKAIATIMVISTGGSGGREGPTAYIAAGLGSMVADALGLSRRERRIALVTGIGAGVGAIFKAPLGGAILAAEVLYTRDFESEAIIPAFLASVVSYSVFCTVEGFEPIFHLPVIEWTISQIPLFLILGVVCAGSGLLYVRSFYRTKSLFDGLSARYNIPPFVRPVIGAALVGLFVVLCAQVSPEFETLALAGLGTGYGFMQLAMFSMLPLSVLLLLPFVKIFLTSLTIGSGGSGGVFGPGIVVGGSTGGAVGSVLHILLPSLVPLQAVDAFIVVGMISLFGAIANAPLAVMIMVVEMTGDFSLLVPAMGAVAVSHLLTGEDTIFLEQVRNKSLSDAHRGEYEIEILDKLSVGEAMVQESAIVTLTPEDPGSRVLDLINTTGHTGFPVVEGIRLAGMVTIGDVREMQAEEILDHPVSEAMARDLIHITPESTLERALELMITHDINHLPVVDPHSSDTLLGFLTRSDIMRAYVHYAAFMKSGQKELDL